MLDLSAASAILGLVSRYYELNRINDEIKKRSRNPILSRSIIQLFGTAGIGKTTFINHSLIPLLQSDYPDLPWVKLDFDRDFMLKNDRYDCRPGRGRVIIDIVHGLFRSINKEPSGKFSEAQHGWETAVAGWSRCEAATPAAERALIDAEEELVGQFNLHVIPSLITQDNRRPVVIILDTVEEIDDKTMGWLQTSLQAPTIQYGYVLWIMAGRFYVNPKAYYLARSYHHLKLEPFKVEQIEQQFPKQADVAASLLQFSHGLPAAARQLAATARDIEREEARKLDADAMQGEAIRGRLMATLEAYVNEKRVLGGLDSYPVAAVRLLSVLRLFNFSVLTQLLAGFLRDYLVADVVADPETIMQRLEASRLVGWHKERRAYVVEEPLRQILADILAHDRPRLYREINERAFELFDRWFRNVAEKRRDYLLEAVYHKAVLTTLPDSGHDFAQLKTLLAGAVEAYYAGKGDEGREGLTELREQLDGDKDLIVLLTIEQREELKLTLESDPSVAQNSSKEGHKSND